jgi:hypothetical protein
MAERIHHEVFGQLQWDRALGCWLGGIDWPPGQYTEVAIWLPEGELAAGLRLAHDSLNWLMDNEEDARCWIASEMLEVYNDAWRDEDEPITADAFIRRIELVRIGFEEDGSLLLSYDGQDMFGGHLIDGVFEPDRSFRHAGLVC